MWILLWFWYDEAKDRETTAIEKIVTLTCPKRRGHARPPHRGHVGKHQGQAGGRGSRRKQGQEPSVVSPRRNGGGRVSRFWMGYLRSWGRLWGAGAGLGCLVPSPRGGGQADRGSGWEPTRIPWRRGLWMGWFAYKRWAHRWVTYNL